MKAYRFEEIAHLGFEIVLHMRVTGSVSWAVWYDYCARSEVAKAAIARYAARPALYPMF